MFLYGENEYTEYDSSRPVRLWRSLCRGEKEALDELFRMFYTPLFDYGSKIIADEDQVKDAIQELFLKLWKKHDVLEVPDSVKAYLLVSMRRILLRSNKRKQNMYERNRKYVGHTFSASFSKEELMIRNEKLEEKKAQLVQAINQLNGRQKEALFLRYYHGLTNREIANVMCINHQSVKNNLYRALKNMRGLVESVPDSV